MSYIDQLREIVLTQFLDQTNYMGVVTMIAEELELVDLAFTEIRTIFDLNASTGAQLDLVGALVNEPRRGRSDVLYRASLEILTKTSASGTPEDVIAAVRGITGADGVHFVNEYPAHFWALPVGGDPSLLTQAHLNRIAPAGVLGLLPCYLGLESPPSGDDNEAVLFDDGDWILIDGPCIFSGPSSGWGIGWGEEWGS